MPVIVESAIWRQHCKDPWLVANYVRKYKDFIERHRLTVKVKKLKEEAHYPLDDLGKCTFEEFDSLRYKNVAMAQKEMSQAEDGTGCFFSSTRTG
jgi:hypothetical protein